MTYKRKRPGAAGGLDSDDEEKSGTVDISVTLNASSGLSTWSYKRAELEGITSQPTPSSHTSLSAALPLLPIPEPQSHSLPDSASGPNIEDERKHRPQVRH